MTRPQTSEEWEDQYDLTRRHPDLEDYLERWRREAADYRKTANAELGVSYGRSRRQKIDLFHPGTSRAAHMFFHGGYWYLGERNTYSHVSSALVDSGVSVAIAGYDLCPDVDIGEIVRQARAGTTFVADHLGVPVSVSGHSAGAHLAAMVVADAKTPADHGVGISGVYDLEAMLHVKLNSVLGLTPEDVAPLSPTELSPPQAAWFRTVVAEAEPQEFHRQAKDLAAAWSAADAGFVKIPQEDHFTILDTMTNPSSPVTALLLEAVELSLA